MGAAAESLTLEKEAPAKSAPAGVQQTAPASSAFDPFVQSIFGSASSEPPASVANSLSIQRFRAPVLQRAQRLYGNRASQQIVMRAQSIQRQCACGGTCAKCQQEEQQHQAQSQDQPPVQRQVQHPAQSPAQPPLERHVRSQAESPVQFPAQPSVQRTSAAPAPEDFSGLPTSTGEQLDPATRRPMEAHFDTDLADVRIHTGSEAANSATSLDALAYTSGRDIYFAPGTYAPSTTSGRRLLAHEVAHVVQQSSGKEPTLATKSSHGPNIGSPDDPLETEADQAAEAFMSAPLTDEDERKKRQSMRGGSGTVQRFIQRQEVPPSSTANATQAVPPTKTGDAPFSFLIPRNTACYTPVGATLTFEGIMLAGNTDYVQSVLRDYFEKHGEKETKEFVSRFVAHMAEVRDASNSAQEAMILRAVTSSLESVLARNRQFLEDFEAKAKEVALGMLDGSETRVNEERIRYGVGWTETKYDINVPDDLPSKTHIRGTIVDYSLKNSPGTKALGQAAGGLLDRKQRYDKAREEMADKYSEVSQWAVELANERGHLSSEQVAEYHRLKDAREQAKRDLYVYRLQKTAEFPILAAYASDEEISEGKLSSLQKMARGTDAFATDMIGSEIKSRLEHISEVRNDILHNNGKETKIWQVPRIIEGTRAVVGTPPGSSYGRLIDEKVKAEAPGIWTSILIGLLQLVLVLAAPFTGGATLIGAAAISVGQAYMHFREYERAEKLRGTDFGAMALSAEDPSLFWLALDIVGAGFDVSAAAGAAVNIFRTLAPAARAARASRAIEDAAKLERAAADLGGEALGKAVASDAAGVSEAARVGETAEEAKSLAHAGEQMAETELKSGFAEAESIAGRTVKVSENGSLWSCASPCTWLRERYKSLLSRKNTDWESRLGKLENEAASIPKGKAGDAARQEVAKKAAALEREMVAFDEELAKEAAYSQAKQKFEMLDPVASEKLLKLERDAAIRFANLNADVLRHLGQLKASSLDKLVSWGLDSSALERIFAKGANAGHVKGQLLEELLNLKMAQPGEITKHVPEGLLEQLEKEGAKLEFFPGHAIKDMHGDQITDGIIGYWEGNRLNIVTFFEVKSGAPAAQGLRYSWTGIAKAKRPDLIKKAQDLGLSALRQDEDLQDLAEALSEAAADVKKSNKAAAKLTLDEVVKQFPNDVEKAWSRLPQSEAGQISKSTERLTEGGGVLRVSGKGEVQTATIGGHAPTAVGVLPAGVSELTLETTMKAAGIRKFKRLQDIPQDELKQVSDNIAATFIKAPVKPALDSILMKSLSSEFRKLDRQL